MADAPPAPGVVDLAREPPTAAAPVRRFKDPAYVPRAASLAEIRAGIDALDERIVPLLAQRAALVKDATRFKSDRYQVAAPARQEAVFRHVRELAEEAARGQGLGHLPRVVDATYRTLVAALIESEQHYFDDTELVGK